jgi:hypothetical protein
MRKFLVCGLIVGGLVWWFWGRTLEPARVIEAQLDAISHGEYQKAYGYLSATAQRRLSLQAFQELVLKNAVLRHNYTSEFLSRKLENNVATFHGTVRTFNSETTPAIYVLIKEGDRWVIQEFSFSSPPL